jgi:hypothetical protein
VKALDLDTLESTARAARDSSEPWRASLSGRYTDGFWAACRAVQTREQAFADIGFVSVASPDAVVALVTRIRDLERIATEALSAWSYHDRGRFPEVRTRIEELRAVVAAGTVLR